MAIEQPVKWSRSRLIVRELMDAFAAVRKIEVVEPNEIPYGFGNLKDAQLARPPRMIWVAKGGVALELLKTKSITAAVPGMQATTTVQTIGYRRTDYELRIWERDVCLVEIALDQLVTASKQIERSDRIVLEQAPWDFPTETEGRWNENGFALIDLRVGVRVEVAKEAIGGRVDVENQGYEFRAGIRNPADEPLEEAEYDVNRLTEPWPG